MTVGERILEIIDKKPGITAGELSEILGKRFQHINNECNALENSRKITADRSSRPYHYYLRHTLSDDPVKAVTKETASAYVSEFERIIKSVTSAAGRPVDSGYIIIDRGIPHIAEPLKSGTMGIYTFLYNDEFLKIGKAGPNSNARFYRQHYLPRSSNSTLSMSILSDSAMQGLGITEDTVGSWIRHNTRRIDIILDSSLGIFTLELIEAALHFKYEPRYEGFKNQR